MPTTAAITTTCYYYYYYYVTAIAISTTIVTTQYCYYFPIVDASWLFGNYDSGARQAISEHIAAVRAVTMADFKPAVPEQQSLLLVLLLVLSLVLLLQILPLLTLLLLLPLLLFVLVLLLLLTLLLLRCLSNGVCNSLSLPRRTPTVFSTRCTTCGASSHHY